MNDVVTGVASGRCTEATLVQLAGGLAGQLETIRHLSVDEPQRAVRFPSRPTECLALLADALARFPAEVLGDLALTVQAEQLRRAARSLRVSADLPYRMAFVPLERGGFRAEMVGSLAPRNGRPGFVGRPPPQFPPSAGPFRRIAGPLLRAAASQIPGVGG